MAAASYRAIVRLTRQRVIVFLLEARRSCWDAEFRFSQDRIILLAGLFRLYISSGRRGGTCTDRRAAEQEVIIDDGLVNFLLPVDAQRWDNISQAQQLKAGRLLPGSNRLSTTNDDSSGPFVRIKETCNHRDRNEMATTFCPDSKGGPRISGNRAQRNAWRSK